MLSAEEVLRDQNPILLAYKPPRGTTAAKRAMRIDLPTSTSTTSIPSPFPDGPKNALINLVDPEEKSQSSEPHGTIDTNRINADISSTSKTPSLRLFHHRLGQMGQRIRPVLR